MTPRPILLLSALTLVSQLAAAETPSSRWALRGSPTWSDKTGKIGGTSYFDNSNRLVADGGRGLRLGLERRFGRSGLELSVERLVLDVEQTTTRSFGPIRPPEVAVASGDFALQPFSLGYLFHPLRSSRVDLYAGPSLSYVTYDTNLDVARDWEPAYGATLGVDFPLGDRWAASVSARYLEVFHEVAGDRDYWGGLRLFSASVGAAYRF